MDTEDIRVIQCDLEGLHHLCVRLIRTPNHSHPRSQAGLVIKRIGLTEDIIHALYISGR